VPTEHQDGRESGDPNHEYFVDGMVEEITTPYQ
jgi:TolB-like protein